MRVFEVLFDFEVGLTPVLNSWVAKRCWVAYTLKPSALTGFYCFNHSKMTKNGSQYLAPSPALIGLFIRYITAGEIMR